MFPSEYLLELGDVVGVDTADGELRCKIGNGTTKEGWYGEAAVYGPDGFIGIPNLPTPAGSAQMLTIQDGDARVAIGSRDNRFASNVGEGKPGDRMIVTDADARVLVKKSTNSVTLYTIGAADDSAVMLDLNGEESQALLLAGKAYIKIADDEITLGVDGGGSIVIDVDGVHVAGGTFNAICGKVNLGDNGGGTPPLPAQTVLYGVNGPAGIASTKVFVSA